MRECWEIHWKDYYQILQIHPLAESEVVKAAYDRLARKYHPDLNQGASAARMKDLNEAFEIISNPEKRKQYYTAFLRVTKEEQTSIPTAQAEPDPKAATILEWCTRCRDYREMKIGFVNHQPAFVTCPVCHTCWDIRESSWNASKPTGTAAEDLASQAGVRQRLDEFLRNKRRFRL